MSQDAGKKREEYWWPGERAVNTRDYLLGTMNRKLRGDRIIMKDVMATLKNTLAADGVGQDCYPSQGQVKNWFKRHEYKAR